MVLVCSVRDTVHCIVNRFLIFIGKPLFRYAFTKYLRQLRCKKTKQKNFFNVPSNKVEYLHKS